MEAVKHLSKATSKCTSHSRDPLPLLKLPLTVILCTSFVFMPGGWVIVLGNTVVSQALIIIITISSLSMLRQIVSCYSAKHRQVLCASVSCLAITSTMLSGMSYVSMLCWVGSFCNQTTPQSELCLSALPSQYSDNIPSQRQCPGTVATPCWLGSLYYTPDPSASCVYQ